MYFLSNYGSFDDECSVAMATLVYEVYSKTMYFAAQVKKKLREPQFFFRTLLQTPQTNIVQN